MTELEGFLFGRGEADCLHSVAQQDFNEEARDLETDADYLLTSKLTFAPLATF